MTGHHHIEWRDSGKEPKVAPNPNYPTGIDVGAIGSTPSCKVALPYPAKRIGVYVVTCQRCNNRVAVTTAGRPDDPRTVTMSCNLAEN